MTVLMALRQHDRFKSIMDDMDIVIRREQCHRAAISVHFPCSLLTENETLTISLLRRRPFTKTEDDTQDISQTAVGKPVRAYIAFYVNTEGGPCIKFKIMKNKDLKNEADCICVLAEPGKTVEAALKRDGRFADNIFFNDIVLQDVKSDVQTLMSSHVEEIKDARCKIIQNPAQKKQKRKKERQSLPSKLAGQSAPESDQPTSESQSLATSSTQLGYLTRFKNPYLKPMPDTKEILDLLRSQSQALINTLMDREKLNNQKKLCEYLQTEFSKNTEIFSEIKRLKKLMQLSNAVCEILCGGVPRGTGFLLLERFILTNAHVIRQNSGHLYTQIAVKFELDDSEGKRLGVKSQPVAWCYENDQSNHIDFALLELQDPMAEVPDPMLKMCACNEPPLKGGICIIGHPDNSVKKMDRCLIIENKLAAVEEHISKNQMFLHVIQQACTEEGWMGKQAHIPYDSCFFYGSSGSPIFDEECKLVGIHSGGYCYKKEKKLDSIFEFGLPLVPIFVYIIRNSNNPQLRDYFQSRMPIVYDLAQNDLFNPHNYRYKPDRSNNEDFKNIIFPEMDVE